MRTRIINFDWVVDKQGPGAALKTIYVPEDEADTNILQKYAEAELNNTWQKWIDRHNISVDFLFMPSYCRPMDEGIARIVITKNPIEYRFGEIPIYYLLGFIEKTTDTHQVWWFVPENSEMIDGLSDWTKTCALRRHGNSHPPDDLFDFDEDGVILPSH